MSAVSKLINTFSKLHTIGYIQYDHQEPLTGAEFVEFTRKIVAGFSIIAARVRIKL